MPNDVFIQNRANAPVRPESTGIADKNIYHVPFKSPIEKRMHAAPSTARVVQPGETGREYAISMAANHVNSVLQQSPQLEQDRQVRMTPEQLKAWLDTAHAYTGHMIYRRDEFLN